MKKIIFCFIILCVLIITGCDNKTTVIEPKIEELFIKTLPKKLEYEINEEFSFEGLVVCVRYDNESIKEITDYKVELVNETKCVISYLDFSTSFDFYRHDKKIIDCYIAKKPSKLEYEYNEELSIDGLVVCVKYNDDSILEVSDYKVSIDDNEFGEIKCTVSYLDYTMSFNFYRKNLSKIDLLDISFMSDKTNMSVNISDYYIRLENILYGKNRTANTMIYFDENCIVNTNIYGYEVAVDKYGMIIDKDVNVTLPDGGFVLSAHGDKVPLLKELNIGDYVLYFKNIAFVYENKYKELENFNYLYHIYLDKYNSILNIDDVLLFNSYAEKLNYTYYKLLSLYNMYSSEVYELVLDELRNINLENEVSINYNHSYSYENINYSLIKEMNLSNEFLFKTTFYTGKLYDGGFRNADTFVIYNASNYRSRNTFGYEVAVDKDGYVIEKEVLVDLPDGGYILSGHSSTAEFIRNKINVGAKIVITSSGFEVYTDIITTVINDLINSRNIVVSDVMEYYKLDIPCDYKTIDKIISLVDDSIIKLKNQTLDYNSFTSFIKNTEELKLKLTFAEALLMTYHPLNSSGVWYYPFANKQCDDTSIEGIYETMDKYSRLGINEIIINPVVNGKSLFEDDYFLYYEELLNYDYKEFGHDFLACFISVAHEFNISVNAFTQTFIERIDEQKVVDESYYQINYQGEKSMGQVYYYDICNENVQEMLLSWYEVLGRYDFDMIEYDIIRYPSSNLYKYLDVDVIDEKTVITDHGYTEYSMNKFMKMYNLEGDLRNLIKQNKEVRSNWLKFKEDELIKFVTSCTSLLRSINPDIIITAAVLSDLETATNSYLQDAFKWLDLGIIDKIEPMVYTDSMKNFNNLVDQFIESDYINVTRYGLSAKLSSYNLLTDFRQLKISSYYGGYVMFCDRYYFNDGVFCSILMKNHSMSLTSCYSSSDKIKEVGYNEVIKMINGYYSTKYKTDFTDLINALTLKNEEQIKEELSNLEYPLMKEYLTNYLVEIINYE